MIALLLLPILVLLSDSASSQTTCFEYAGGVLSCDGPNNSNRTFVPMGRNGGIITDERGNLDTYSIQRNRRAEEDRREEERRREMIYGDDRRRDDSRSRSRWDEEYGR